MSRHQLRLLAIQILYTWDFYDHDTKRLNGIISDRVALHGLEAEDSNFFNL